MHVRQFIEDVTQVVHIELHFSQVFEAPLNHPEGQSVEQTCNSGFK